MKKPEDEAIRAMIIEEYRTKPLHLVRKYMKEELNIDASIRSVRTWLKEWGARKTDQSTTANSCHHHRPTPRGGLHQAQNQYPSPIPQHDFILQPSFMDGPETWPTSSEQAQPSSPSSSRTSRRPTGLRIQTRGLDDLSTRSPITVRSLPHDHKLHEKSSGEEFDQFLAFTNDGQQTVAMGSPFQYDPPELERATDQVQMPGGPSHCPSLLSPNSCNGSSSNFSSAPNSFSVLSPSPMEMSYPDDLWSRAAQSYRQYPNGESEAPQYLSPNMVANRNGVGMRQAQGGPVNNVMSSAASSPYVLENHQPEVKASHLGDRAAQAQTQLQTYVSPMAAAYPFPGNPQVLHYPMTQCQCCGVSQGGHHHGPSGSYGQDHQGQLPGANLSSMSYSFPF